MYDPNPFDPDNPNQTQFDEKPMEQPPQPASELPSQPEAPPPPRGSERNKPANHNRQPRKRSKR